MWPNPKETADLVPFTEEILNGKLHFLCSVGNYIFLLVFFATFPVLERVQNPY